MMNKQSYRLLLLGNLLMSLPMLLRSWLPIPEDPADFLKGFGVALILAAAFTMRKNKCGRTCAAASDLLTENESGTNR